MAAIEIRGLTKSYGDVHAVSGVDLTVEQGEILAFLGPNGAGKTTTIEILEGFRQRTSGDVFVLGEDPQNATREWRERIGIVLQESKPDGDLTALETLTLYAAYYTNPRDPQEVLDVVGLGDAGGQRADKLSGGQQRRLDLALALIGNPELVFLDEPTTGFDPSARRESWEMIENLRDLGVTVLLTTHYMDEAQHLADRIAVISDGKIVAQGTAADLAERVSLLTRVSWDEADAVAAELPARFAAAIERVVDAVDGVRLTVETEDVMGLLEVLLAAARTQGSALTSLEVQRPTLEDTFLRLIAQESGSQTSDADGGPSAETEVAS
ncbi:MAG: ABC-2 type transport system ATP-binding protein [Candidatus Poriferisodalaceae bacterium]|jgi:ABC-2 type transport system ATP-binding protein